MREHFAHFKPISKSKNVKKVTRTQTDYIIENYLHTPNSLQKLNRSIQIIKETSNNIKSDKMSDKKFDKKFNKTSDKKSDKNFDKMSNKKFDKKLDKKLDKKSDNDAKKPSQVLLKLNLSKLPKNYKSLSIVDLSRKMSPMTIVGQISNEMEVKLSSNVENQSKKNKTAFTKKVKTEKVDDIEQPTIIGAFQISEVEYESLQYESQRNEIPNSLIAKESKRKNFTMPRETDGSSTIAVDNMSSNASMSEVCLSLIAAESRQTVKMNENGTSKTSKSSKTSEASLSAESRKASTMNENETSKTSKAPKRSEASISTIMTGKSKTSKSLKTSETSILSNQKEIFETSKSSKRSKTSKLNETSKPSESPKTVEKNETTKTSQSDKTNNEDEKSETSKTHKTPEMHEKSQTSNSPGNLDSDQSEKPMKEPSNVNTIKIPKTNSDKMVHENLIERNSENPQTLFETPKMEVIKYMSVEESNSEPTSDPEAIKDSNGSEKISSIEKISSKEGDSCSDHYTKESKVSKIITLIIIDVFSDIIIFKYYKPKILQFGELWRFKKSFFFFLTFATTDRRVISNMLTLN